ncbi:MAG: translation initiation factor IF-6 [Candidatus Diapherotrites archaeon]
MEIEKGTVRGSPYLGVFSVVTEDVAILPKFVEQKEIANYERTLGIEVIKANIMESALAGIFMTGVGKKFVVPYAAGNGEVKFLRSQGLEIEMIGATALGNMIALNSSGGVVSRLLPHAEREKLADFFGIKFEAMDVAGSDVPGSAITVTENGFIVNPNVNEKEFKMLGKIFGVSGKPTTANYGDPFVGNDVVANSRGAIVGTYTSGHELIRIDEGLRGE